MKFKSLLLAVCLLAIAFSCLCSATSGPYVINPYKTVWPIFFDDANGTYILKYNTQHFYVANHELTILDGNFPDLSAYYHHDDANLVTTDYDVNNVKHSDANFVMHADANLAWRVGGYIVIDANRVTDACAAGSTSFQEWIRAMQDPLLEPNDFPVRKMAAKDSNDNVGYIPMFNSP